MTMLLRFDINDFTTCVLIVDVLDVEIKESEYMTSCVMKSI